MKMKHSDMPLFSQSQKTITTIHETTRSNPVIPADYGSVADHLRKFVNQTKSSPPPDANPAKDSQSVLTAEVPTAVAQKPEAKEMQRSSSQ